MDHSSGNQLGRESSPYLRQHALQPVHWRAWSQASLDEAQNLDRPIMLSIGYAACHWCHVMAHESFDDPGIASILNDSFVNIKVDREERPDIDQLYMTALQATGEQGGWPLTMFLTPDGAPFWGGTYFPPQSRWGRPCFADVLRAMAAAYARHDPAVVRNAAALIRAIQATAESVPQAFAAPGDITRAAQRLKAMADTEQGGLQGAPKFPNFPVYRFLAQRSFRGDAGAREAVRRLLRAICEGGIYDHVGGGMFRYTTDAVWLVPHFEKMLYDNAQLLDALALAHADAPDPVFEAAAIGTVAFLTRDLDAQGAFASSLDADSDGGEGAFYVWTGTEIAAVLGDRAAAFGQAFDVTPQGNWEGRTILRRRPAAAAADEAALVADLRVLASARANRTPPALDDKVLADWNGMAIAALCRAAAVFDRPQWLDEARARYACVASRLRPAGRWSHAWRYGRVSAPGLLDDLAAIGNAAVSLHQATGEASYLGDAQAIVAEADAWYGPASQGYAMTAADTADIPSALATRPRSAACSAVPSGSGMMAQMLARLYHLTGDPTYRARARAIIEAFAGRFRQPAASATLLAAAELLEDGVVVVVAGAPELPATLALRAVALASADPARSVLLLPPGAALPMEHPAYGKSAPAGTALAYVCRGAVCLPPVADPEPLRQILSRQTVSQQAPLRQGGQDMAGYARPRRDSDAMEADRHSRSVPDAGGPA